MNESPRHHHLQASNSDSASPSSPARPSTSDLDNPVAPIFTPPSFSPRSAVPSPTRQNSHARLETSPLPLPGDASSPTERASSSTNSDPLVGMLVAQRYVIESRLARGGMATVYRATDQRLGRRVAVKVMHPHLAEDAQFIARFDREARSAARISHPNVVTVSDQGFVDGRPFLVMDLIQGPNLRQLLHKEGSFSLNKTLKLTSDILHALRAAAREDVIHRDIKPENVLLSADGMARVTDFGLARAVTEASMSMTGAMLGTVTYMAPEIATADLPDQRTDLYSVGIMVYEMLTGKVPWHGENAMYIAYAHVHEDVPAPSEKQAWIPREVDDFVATLAARQPDDRPANAQEALDLLGRLEAALPPELLNMRSSLPISPSETGAEASQQTPEPSANDVEPANSPQAGDTHSENLPPEDTDLSDMARNFSPHGTADEVSQGSDRTDVSAGDHEELDDRALAEETTIDIQAFASSAAVMSETEILDFAGMSSEDVPQHETRLFPPVYPHQSRSSSTTSTGSEDEKIIESEPQRPRRKGLLTFLTLVLTLLIGAGSYAGYWWWTEWGPGSYLKMPITDTRPISDVQKDLSSIGLKVEVSEEFSDTVDKGIVISSQPRSAAEVQKYAVVQLKVSKGVDLREVPLLSGQPADKASELLKEKGLALGDSKKEWSETIAEGIIVSQSSEAGSQLRVGSKVNVIISQGREPFTVPALTGKSKEEATAALAALNLTLEAEEAFSDSVPAGILISQETAEGTILHRGDVVKVTVSKGPEMREVPSIFGMGKDQAIAKLEEAGFKVEISNVAGGLLGIGHSTNPPAGTSLPKGSTITLYLV